MTLDPPRSRARHTTDAPVFLIGHGSSGTSILTKLLRENLGVAFGTESQFVIRYYRRLAEYGDLTDDRNLRRLVSHLATERWFRRSAKFGFRTDADAIVARVRERSYRGVLDAIFSEFASQLGLSRWGDKTPDYNHDLGVLDELFPEARYIHMVRDGRDVAVSVFARYWGHKNVYMAASDWRDEIDLVDRFTATLPPGRFIEVRYEGLLRSPVETMARLITFLEIDDADGSLLASIERTVPAALNRTNFDKWRRAWPAPRRVAYERIACEQLRRHGYETVVDEPGPAPGSAARLFWYCDNKVRKLTYADYWRDNLYKARLRAQDGARTILPAPRTK